MFRLQVFFFAFILPVLAQDLRLLSYVRGVVLSEEPLAGNHFVVDLIDSTYHKQTIRAYVGADGNFEFRDVPVGAYTVVLGASDGDPIQQQSVNLSASVERIELRVPTQANKLVGSGTVSVRQLQHPLSAKSKKMFEAAEKASVKGEYLREIEILRGALNDPAAVPYARMNIGVAYLKAGQAASAVGELQEAARLMPENSVAHTNLAYALLLTKRIDAAEVEGRRALELDRSNAKARWVMGSILLSKGAREEEAVEDLRLASREMPKARMILAQYYERHGQKDAAARELRAFLPQASETDRVTVEQWLTKLAAK